MPGDTSNTYQQNDTLNPDFSTTWLYIPHHQRALHRMPHQHTLLLQLELWQNPHSTTCDDTSTPSDRYFIYWEGLHKHCLLLNPFMLYIYIIEYIHIKPKHFILLTAVIITTTTPNNTRRTTNLSTCTCYITTTSSSSHLKQDFNPTTTKSQHHPRKVWWKNVVQF